MTTHHTSLYNSETTPAPRKVLKQELVTWEETANGLRIARLTRNFGGAAHNDTFTSEHVPHSTLNDKLTAETATDIAALLDDPDWEPQTDNPVWMAFKEQLNSIAKGGYLGRDTPFGVKRKGKDDRDG
jgi:hypothetical protein